ARASAAEAQYPQAAAELGEMLLAPVANHLQKPRLVIVADGILQYVPFAALPTPESARRLPVTPLVAEHEIVNLPSASTLAVIRREAPGRGKPDRTLAVFADPVFQDTDLRVHRSARSTPQQIARDGATLKAPNQRNLFRGSEATGIKVDLP